MSQFVTTHFVQQYTTNVQILAQQKGSRFRNAVTTGSYVGKQGVPVDQFAPTVANKRGTRYPTLTPADTQTDRRWVYPSDYDWNDLIDNIDKLRMLIDPQSAYVQNGMNAMARAMDDEIISAFFANAQTGAPGIATALGGPLAGMAVSAIGNALGIDQPTQEKISAAIAGASPEDMLKLKEADQNFAVQIKKLDIDLAQIEESNLDSARKRESAVGDKTNRNLAYVIVGAFVALVATTLLGYTQVDSVLAGTLVGYLSAKCEQVLAYYFGSSRSSDRKTELLAQSPAIKAAS